MALVRGARNKSTELKLMELMKRDGITGWRRGTKVLGAPDFVWRRERIALFVDGCFWHGCPRHRRVPKSRVEFWEAKLTANRRRDRLVTRTLRADGWTVLRVWECALTLKRQPPTLRRIRRALEAKKPAVPDPAAEL